MWMSDDERGALRARYRELATQAEDVRARIRDVEAQERRLGLPRRSPDELPWLPELDQLRGQLRGIELEMNDISERL